MLSDIADAAAISERLGPERWDRVVREHHALVGRSVGDRGGQVARFDGDGFFAVFHSAHAGLRAAIELQRAFAQGMGAVDGEVLALRIGLHSGFVIATPEEPQGRNAVLAARIAAHAVGGEILVSASLKQYTERDPTFSFEPRGEHHFKGLLGEHPVYAVPWG